MGENRFDENVETVIYNLFKFSKPHSFYGRMAGWVKASVLTHREILQRFESYISLMGVLPFFQKLPIFKSLYLFCATFRHYRTFSIQFCLLQRAPKLKLIHLLLPAQFYIFLYKIGQKWSLFIGLFPHISLLGHIFIHSSHYIS